MRFRGPLALKDSLLGSRSRHCYAIKSATALLMSLEQFSLAFKKPLSLGTRRQLIPLDAPAEYLLFEKHLYLERRSNPLTSTCMTAVKMSNVYLPQSHSETWVHSGSDAI
jgi:hypothetical protein